MYQPTLNWSAWTFVGQRQGDLSVHMCVCTPASQHYFLWDYNHAVTATAAADHDRLQIIGFWCFLNCRKKDKKYMWCVQCLFDLHVNGNDDGICINTVKAFLQSEELGFFNNLCSIKLTTFISWKVFYGEICSLAQQSTYR